MSDEWEYPSRGRWRVRSIALLPECQKRFVARVREKRVQRNRTESCRILRQGGLYAGAVRRPGKDMKGERPLEHQRSCRLHVDASRLCASLMA
jgi:hypothetical protein